MKITSTLKKTISTASLIVLSSASLQAGTINTSEQALDVLTGPNQPTTGEHSICLSVTPYFLTSMMPGGRVMSRFTSLQIDGATPMSKPEGDCHMPDENGTCARGYIKVVSTAPILCNVPIGL